MQIEGEFQHSMYPKKSIVWIEVESVILGTLFCFMIFVGQWLESKAQPRFNIGELSFFKHIVFSYHC